MRRLVIASIVALAPFAGGCGDRFTDFGRDECIVSPPGPGLVVVGCATAEGTVLDSLGRPMPAVYMSFGGSLTPGRVGIGSGENAGDNNITDQAGHYRMRTGLTSEFGAVVPDTATVWVVAVRIDTLPSGVTVHGPRDSVSALLRFGPAGLMTPRSQVPPITLPQR